MPQTYRNNALHDIALKAIELVHQAHHNGAGTAPLNLMAHLFGLPFSENDIKALGQRGDFVFTRTDDDGGTVSNNANPMDINATGMKISLPREIIGTYVVSPHSFTVSFDDNKTISGSFLLLRSKLEGVHVDYEQIKVDLSGDSFDQCILHGPPQT